MKRRAFRLAPCRTAAQGRRELTGLQANSPREANLSYAVIRLATPAVAPLPANTNCGSYLSQAACISGIVGFPPSTARFQSRHSATATTRHDSGWLCGPNRSRLNRRLLAPLATRPFKPASLAVLEGVEKFRALRRAFLKERHAALTGGGDCADKMDALNRCEIAYREAKLELFKALPHPTRQAVWDRL